MVLASIAVLAAVTYVVLAATPGTDITDARRTHGTAPMADLRDATWSPVRTMLAGDNPYAPNERGAETTQPFVGYLPHHLLLHLPYGLLPLGAAQGVSIATAILAVATFTTRLVPGRTLPSAKSILLAAGALATYPGLQMVTLGQTTFESLVGIALLNRASTLSRAVGFALVTQKPQIGLPVVIVQIAIDGWRPMVKASLPTVLLLLVACVPLSVSAGGPVDLARSFVDGLENHQDAPGDTLDPTSTLRIDTAATIARATRSEPSITLKALAAGIVVAAAAVAGRRRHTPPAQAGALVATLALVAHPYTAPLLLTLVADSAGRQGWSTRTSRKLIAIGWAIATATQLRIGGASPVDVSPATTAAVLGATSLLAGIISVAPAPRSKLPRPDNDEPSSWPT